MKSYKTFSFPRNYTCLLNTLASLVPQMVKNPPAMQDTWVRYLGQEDPLEKGMATHCNILAWKIPRTEEPGGLQSMGSKEVRHELLLLLLDYREELILHVLIEVKVFGTGYLHWISSLLRELGLDGVLVCLDCTTKYHRMKDLNNRRFFSHSSGMQPTPAWRIPRTGEPGGLQSIGSQRIGHG